MKQDLREAYAALKLLRADLTNTRREKKALEASLMQLQTTKPRVCTHHARESRDMQLEDFHSQLWHYETQLTEMINRNSPTNYRREDQDNQLENQQEMEKLALLHKLHSLTATVEQQTETILAQQATFLLQKGELETTVEETQVQLQAERKKVADAVLAQQEMKEKYDFLEIQVEILKQEKKKLEDEIANMQIKLAAHAQTSSILKQQLEEMEKKNELLKLQQEGEEHRRHMSELERDCAELKAQVKQLEDDRFADMRKYEEDLETSKEQYVTTIGTLETKLEEMQQKVAESEMGRVRERKEYKKNLVEVLKKLHDKQEENDSYVATLRMQEKDLVAVKCQLETSEKMLSEEVSKHQTELKEAQQRLEKELHDRQTMTLFSIQSKLSKAEAQLAESEIKAQVEGKEKEKAEKELLETRQSLKCTTAELLHCQSLMKTKTQEQLEEVKRCQEQCESFETQLLSLEDRRDSCVELKDLVGVSASELTAMASSKAWSLVRSGIKQVESFLPYLQTRLSVIHDALTLCAAHAETLPTLCERLEDREEKDEFPILLTAVRLLRLVLEVSGRIKHDETLGELLQKRVLEALAQWYEHGAGDRSVVPTPTFTITSRETALILQNWTHDRTKQLGVRRWLARMEAYPGVPPLRGASANRVLELPPEGCMLELDEMTSEVKDAFLLLLIPILKQNRALHVRVFTRYLRAMDSMLLHEREEEQKAWSMRIHVQSSVSETKGRSFDSFPSYRTSGPLSPVSVSSVSSSTSSTASSRRQIIQERLQYLHNNA